MKFRRLNEEDFLDIRLLEEKELNRDCDNNYYTYDDASYFKKALFNNGGVVFGVYDNDELVAFAGNMLLEAYDEAKDYFIEKLKENEIETESTKVAFFNNTLVSKSHRGQGLQKKLRELTIEHYKEQGISEFITTTSEKNIASAKNLIKLGMRELTPLTDTPYSKKTKRFFYLK